MSLFGFFRLSQNGQNRLALTLVVSDKQIDLENVYSVGIRAKKDYYIKYIGNSSYQSQFQDVDCLMFRYYDYEPDNERLLELYDTIKLDD